MARLEAAKFEDRSFKKEFSVSFACFVVKSVCAADKPRRDGVEVVKSVCAADKPRRDGVEVVKSVCAADEPRRDGVEVVKLVCAADKRRRNGAGNGMWPVKAGGSGDGRGV